MGAVAGQSLAASAGEGQSAPTGFPGESVVVSLTDSGARLLLQRGATRSPIDTPGAPQMTVEVRDLDGDGVGELIARDEWEDGAGQLSIYRRVGRTYQLAYRRDHHNPLNTYRQVEGRAVIVMVSPSKLGSYLREIAHEDWTTTDYPLGFIQGRAGRFSLKSLGCDKSIANEFVVASAEVERALRAASRAARPEVTVQDVTISRADAPRMLRILTDVRRSAVGPCRTQT